MNKSKRKRLAKISEQLEGLKCEIEELINEEEESFGNLPESFQVSARGDRMLE